MEHKGNEVLSSHGMNKEKDIFGRARNALSTAFLVGTAIAGGSVTMSEHAQAGTFEAEFKESGEMQFERILIQNELLFNQELAKRNIPLVRFGKPMLTFRCGVIQIGIYTEKGEHIMDTSCTLKEFNNRYEFIETAKKKIIPRLFSKFGGTVSPQESNVYIPRMSPEQLLKMARFDYSAINFFGLHDLVLTSRVIQNKDGSHGTAYVCIERKKDSKKGSFRDDICYDDSTLQADFSYSQKKDALTIKVINQDGTVQAAELVSEYTRDGILSSFR